MTTSPAPAATLGPPSTAPGPSDATPHTYGPNSGNPPIAPGAPGASNGNSTDNRSVHSPTTNDVSHPIEAPKVNGVPAVSDGPQLSPPPVPRPEGSDRVTSRPLSPGYFQLLPSPPSTVPARTVSLPKATSSLPADDGGWVPVK